MKRRVFVGAAAVPALAFLSACSTTGSASSDPALKRKAIDSDVDLSLSKLYTTVDGSRELVAKASGVLVFPSIVSAGLIVGGSYGQGALRVGGRSIDYYSATAGSVGLLAGAQSKQLFLLFMTHEALDRFRSSAGWTAGVDASVTLVKVGASGRVDTETARQQVVGFVLSGGGLRADLSLEGTKFSKLSL
jgi:lipid-binding SYLF domain-containing protein